MLTLKTLTKKEQFDLKRSIGNNVSGFKAPLSPKEVSDLLQKAIDNGHSIKEISEFLELKTIASGSTMVSRTIRLFKNLHPDLHNKVVYKSYANRKNIDNNTISFQSAVELTRFPIEQQKKVYSFVIKNKLSKENIKSIIYYTKTLNMTLEEGVEKLKIRKGASNEKVFIQEIKLKELNPNLAKISQVERNKIFLELIKKVFKNMKFTSHHLGISTYSISYKLSSSKNTRKKLMENNETLIKEIENYDQ